MNLKLKSTDEQPKVAANLASQQDVKRYITVTCPDSFFSRSMKYNVARSRHIPWPQSPNITANRKGKVTIV